MSKSKKTSDVDIILTFLEKTQKCPHVNSILIDMGFRFSTFLHLSGVTQENRPFSVQNIVDALQKQGVKKTAAERALALLVEQAKVKKKEYGKAKIFLFAQDTLQLPDEQDVADTDEQLASLAHTMTETKERIAEHRQRVATLKAEYTLPEALQQVHDLQKKLDDNNATREKLGDASTLLSKEDKLEIDKHYYDVRVMWKKYKSLVNNIFDQIGEGTGKNRKELAEEIGIETDEDADVKFSDFPDIANPHKARKATDALRNAKRQKQT